MTHASVEPMNKPNRERDFYRASTKKSRRFKKQNVENDKRREGFEMARVVDHGQPGGRLA